jgi:hypothetical protein
MRTIKFVIDSNNSVRYKVKMKYKSKKHERQDFFVTSYANVSI